MASPPRTSKSQTLYDKNSWYEIDKLAKNISGLSRVRYLSLPQAERHRLRVEAAKQLGVEYAANDLSRWVYVVAHPSWPGQFKVGITTNVRHRLASYNTGCPERRYQMRFAKHHEDAQRVVQQIYDALSTKRLQGEWFEVDELELVDLMEAAFVS
jgi:hypothetical protein